MLGVVKRWIGLGIPRELVALLHRKVLQKSVETYAASDEEAAG